MMVTEQLLSTYLNIHIILLIAAGIWIFIRQGFALTALKHAYHAQLKLAYGVLISVILAVPVLYLIQTFSQQGWISRGALPNASDFVVAQFLDGKIAMAPTQFENLLLLRREFTHDMVTLSSLSSQVVATLLALATLFLGYRLFRSAFAVQKTVKGAYVMRRIGKVDIRVTPDVCVPFSTKGLWRYQIVLPASILARSTDMRVAITHELQHIRQGDLGWEIVMEVLRPLIGWNPAFHFWKREVEQLRELACDQQVLRSNRMSVREYGECLLRVCNDTLEATQKAPAQMRPTVPMVPFDGQNDTGASAKFLKRRVRTMTSKAATGDTRLLAYGFASLLTVAVLAGALIAQPSGDWSQDRLMLSTIVNLERMDTRNGLGR